MFSMVYNFTLDFDVMRRVLVTGGTGSFGRAFVKRLLDSDSDIERLVVFSRDELKQWKCRNTFPPIYIHKFGIF